MIELRPKDLFWKTPYALTYQQISLFPSPALVNKLSAGTANIMSYPLREISSVLYQHPSQAGQEGRQSSGQIIGISVQPIVADLSIQGKQDIDTHTISKIDLSINLLEAQLEEEVRIGWNVLIGFVEQISEVLCEIVWDWFKRWEDILVEERQALNTSYNFLYLANLTRFGDFSRGNYANLAEDLIEGVNFLQWEKGGIEHG